MSLADALLAGRAETPISAPTGWPDGWRLIALDTVDSTNRVARELAGQGAPDGTVVTARRQDKGRGRRARGWVSLDGNLYMSVVLRPMAPPETAGQLTFVVALAVADALRTLAPPADVSLKWPNDGLVDGRKIAGVLLEADALAEPDAAWVVAGIGVNLVSHPPDSAFPATDLAAAGTAGVPVEAALAALISALHDWYGRWRAEGFAPIRQAWLAQAAGLGEPIQVRLERETLMGVFADLDDDGGLLLDLPGGGRRRIAAGDVFFAGQSEEDDAADH